MISLFLLTKSDCAAGVSPRRRISSPSAGGLQLGSLELGGLLAAALSVVLKDEGDAVALVEHGQPRALDGRRVHEHVLGAIFRGDEAEPLGAVEELDCSGDSHGVKPVPLW